MVSDSCDPMDCSPPGSSVHRDSPGKNTGVGCHFLLRGIFLTQELNPGLLHCFKPAFSLSSFIFIKRFFSSTSLSAVRVIGGETVETVSDFIFLGSKITADGDCNYESKRCLLLGRKVMTNLDSILKSRHYFANKSPSGQGYGFSSGHVWM